MATQLDLTDEILDQQALSTVIVRDDVEAEREVAQLAAAIAQKAKTPEDILVDEDPKNLPYDWPTVIWIGVVHIGALAAPFFFTWKALGLFAFLCWLTGSIGVCMGYHRLLTHGSVYHLSADPLAAGPAGRTVGRRLGAHLGGQPSQASPLQRQGRRSALPAPTARGGATCCGSCPTSAASIARDDARHVSRPIWPETP